MLIYSRNFDIISERQTPRDSKTGVFTFYLGWTRVYIKIPGDTGALPQNFKAYLRNSESHQKNKQSIDILWQLSEASSACLKQSITCFPEDPEGSCRPHSNPSVLCLHLLHCAFPPFGISEMFQ